MKERIQQIIRYKSLSSARFADLIKVQRSSVSHILTGRNKPSMDFMEKLIRTFPDVNAQWLITGTGQMLSEESEKTSPKQPNGSHSVNGTGLFKEENTIKSNENVPAAPQKSKTSEELTKDQKEEIVQEPKNIEQPQSVIDETKNSVAPKEPSKSTPIKKEVEQVVIFYADGSFKAYNPS